MVGLVVIFVLYFHHLSMSQNSFLIFKFNVFLVAREGKVYCALCKVCTISVTNFQTIYKLKNLMICMYMFFRGNVYVNKSHICVGACVYVVCPCYIQIDG